MRNPEWFERWPTGVPRTRQAGEEVWRLHHPDGRVQACELRDDSKPGAGWDVLLLEGGEPLLSRRRSNEREARYVAEVFKQDTMRGGWAVHSEGKAP